MVDTPDFGQVVKAQPYRYKEMTTQVLRVRLIMIYCSFRSRMTVPHVDDSYPVF